MNAQYFPFYHSLGTTPAPLRMLQAAFAECCVARCSVIFSIVLAVVVQQQRRCEENDSGEEEISDDFDEFPTHSPTKFIRLKLSNLISTFSERYWTAIELLETFGGVGLVTFDSAAIRATLSC